MAYSNIQPHGGDTGTLLNLSKRIAIIQNLIDIRGKIIVDFGCGAGQYVQALLLQGADAHGIEYEGEKVARFKREHPQISERVRQGNIEAEIFEAGSVDVALLNEVLEHVSNETKTLQEIRRVLKPKGLLILFAPNRLYPFETHSVSLKHSNRQVPIYIPFIPYVPLGLGQRVFTYIARNYWPHELRRKVRACGFTIIGTGYLWQTFENISGSRPRVVTLLRRVLRRIFAFLERIPVVKVFGASQIVIAQK
jgi:SAM-dependent methyltransferase